MKINRIHLENFKGYRDLTVDLDAKLTVIVGENGSGKSSILDAISKSLSWIVARIKNQKGQGKFVNEIDVYNNQRFCTIESEFDTINRLTLSHSSYGYSRDKQFNKAAYYDDLNLYVANFHSEYDLDNRVNLPTLVHYGVKRAVVEVPLRIRKKEKPLRINPWRDGRQQIKVRGIMILEKMHPK